MTLLYVELGVLILALVGVMAVFWVAHLRLLGKLYDRQATLDHYAKSAARESLGVLAEARRAAEETAAVREDTRLIQRRVEQHMSDPRIKAALDVG